MNDFLGNEIKVGMRAIRVDSYSHMKQFKKVTVKEIDETRTYNDSIGIITDGNTRMGWTYPHRLLVETSFTVEI